MSFTHNVTARVVKRNKPVVQKRAAKTVVPLISPEEEIELLKAEIELQERTVAEGRRRQQLRREMTEEISQSIGKMRASFKAMECAPGASAKTKEILNLFNEMGLQKKDAEELLYDTASEGYHDDFEIFNGTEESCSVGDAEKGVCALVVETMDVAELRSQVCLLLETHCLVEITAASHYMEALLAMIDCASITVSHLSTSAKEGTAQMHITVSAD